MSSHHRTSAWTIFSNLARKRIQAALPLPCVERCKRGGMVEVGDKWDVSHIVAVADGGEDTMDNVGPAHTQCNRSAGGTTGARVSNAKRKVSRRLLPW